MYTFFQIVQILVNYMMNILKLGVNVIVNDLKYNIYNL